MRLLLIEANDVNKWVGGRAGGNNVHVVPIALVGLASYVRRAVPEVAVKIIESSLDAPADDALRDLLEEFRPDYVGVRAINFFRDEAARIVRVVRRWADVPVVLGGPLPTSMRGTTFDWIPELVLAAVGEGERVLERLLAGECPEQIPGMMSRSPTGVRQVAEEAPLRNLDAVPLPDYSLVDLDKYSRTLSYAYNQRRQGVLVTSRGCPYRCTYCFQPGDSKMRLRSASHVFEEIEVLVRERDVQDFYIVDDVFNVHRRRALEVLRLLKEASLGVRLYFVNGLRVDLCDREMVDALVEGGTVWVAFAVETASPRIAALVRKTIDLAHARDIIGYAQSAGIVVNVNTMFGFPTETAAEAQMTLDYLGTLPHPSLLPYHFNLRGYHGCEIVDQAEAAGWDRAAFLEHGLKSYNDLPPGSPTFSRHEQIAHLIQYHERFGLKNQEHVAWSVKTLRNISYRDEEIVAMYSVLLNRPVASVDELLSMP